MASKQPNLCVSVRVCPLTQQEKDANSNYTVRLRGEVVDMVARESHEPPPFKATFDHAFWSCNTFVPGNRNENAPQEVIYSTIGTPMLQNTFDGYNSCLFAYGQTGSGKTYTVMGNPSDEGIAPRMGQDIFQRVKSAEKDNKDVVIEVSFLEIYNEKVRDLLNPDPKGFDGKKLRVREHPKLGTFVEGLSQFVVTNARDLHDMVVVGNKMRTTGATQMNMESSRSHAILTIRVTQTNKAGALVTTRRSLMNLVDLAGSERADKTGATGARLAEGSNINKSLTALGMVISQLSEGKDKHIPYRDSMLTWILKDTLGGNSMTTMLATISPASYNYDETISTLRYAECAKKIKNKAVVNLVTNGQRKEIVESLEHDIYDAATTSDNSLVEAYKYLLNEMRLLKGERRARTRSQRDRLEVQVYEVEAARRQQQLEHQQHAATATVEGPAVVVTSASGFTSRRFSTNAPPTKSNNSPNHSNHKDDHISQAPLPDELDIDIDLDLDMDGDDMDEGAVLKLKASPGAGDDDIDLDDLDLDDLDVDVAASRKGRSVDVESELNLSQTGLGDTFASLDL